MHPPSASAVHSTELIGSSTRTPAASTRSSSSSGLATREQFTAEELATVLSHFDLGVIESIQEYPRGSRKSPKVLITTAQQGRFLLKRRARGKDEPQRVAFCHAIQLHLASRQFPLPHLIGTRADNNSLLSWRGGVYELFEYIPGQPYPQTLEATADAGRVQGLFHKLLLDFHSPYEPSAGSYHRATAVDQGLKRLLAQAEGTPDEGMMRELDGAYHRAADAADATGLPNWPRQIVHADWHPGNMLFRDDHVVAVIDYDSARLLPRVIDVANGALQFSIIASGATPSGDADVSHWPDYTDESRFRRFLRGYDRVLVLSEAETRAMPWLMIEALIAESVFPIAATGTFGRTEGGAFLQMVQRKVRWLEAHAARLIEIAEG